MNRKVVIILISSIVILIASGVTFALLQEGSLSSLAATSDAVHNRTNNNQDKSDYTYIPPTVTEDAGTAPDVTEEPFVPATEMDLDPNSITVFVNKEYALPKDYQPEDLVTPDIYFNLSYYDERTLMRKDAARAIEALFAAAEEDGCSLSGVSGYRSYQRQKKIFLNNIVTKGKTHTLKYSAVPGTSEHQTGLVMDISCASLRYDLNAGFIKTPEGQWVAENAHRFGFIVRYPDGKADITGYSYEPWHIRYVGKALAKYLYEHDLTLEEYYNYTPSPDFDFEAVYASLINYKPPVTATPLPISGSDLLPGEDGEIVDGDIDGVEDPDSKDDPGASEGGKPGGGKTPTPAPTPTEAVEEPTGEPEEPDDVPVTVTPDPGDADDSGNPDTGNGTPDGGSGTGNATTTPGLTQAPLQ
ncbi:MAG TPA: M15 family metallopeptidase [Clostridiales bacterium]|nr:M15 family metallopeptidase [Clostridiales bacterium]